MIDWGNTGLEFKIIVLAGLVLAVIALCSFIRLIVYYINSIRNVYVPDDGLSVDVAYFREKGKRKNQEDDFYISPLPDYKQSGVVACVSDGMGGLKYGEQISQYVVDRVAKLWPISFFASEQTSESIRDISDDIFKMYSMKGGATLAMVHICNGYMHFYSVGDSNIILIRDGKATILNQKQNYAVHLIKTLVRNGKTTQVAYGNSKTRALTDFVGNHNTRVIYTNRPMKVYDGDTVVVCSDGVTDSVPTEIIAQYCSKHSAQNTASNIKMSVKLHRNKRQDNYTGVVVKLSRSLV